MRQPVRVLPFVVLIPFLQGCPVAATCESGCEEGFACDEESGTCRRVDGAVDAGTSSSSSGQVSSSSGTVVSSSHTASSLTSSSSSRPSSTSSASSASSLPASSSSISSSSRPLTCNEICQDDGGSHVTGWTCSPDAGRSSCEVATCAQDFGDCADGGLRCGVSLLEDEANCGACGEPIDTQRADRCEGGAPKCGASAECDDVDGGPIRCAPPQGDGGVPVCCSQGLSNCQGTCVDLVADPGQCACDGGTCTYLYCGDNAIRSGVEECDDGNDIDNDGCRNSCLDARCGDGVTRPGFEGCDDENLDDTDDCPTNCQPARCGDGYVRVDSEECDDGNQVDDDGCTGCRLPRTRHAFFTTKSFGLLFHFLAEPAHGTLRPFGAQVFGELGGELGLHPSGNILFASDPGSAALFVYRIDPSYGTLTRPTISNLLSGIPGDLVAEPTGRFLYVTDETTPGVVTMTIDTTGDTLTPLGDIAATETKPTQLALSPDGFNLYSLNALSNSISIFAINSGNGALAPVGTPVATGAAPSAIAMDPKGRFVLVANTSGNSVSVYARGENGVLVKEPSDITGFPGARGVAIDPSGRFAFVAATYDGTVHTLALLGEQWTRAGSASAPNVLKVFADPGGSRVYAPANGGMLVFDLDRRTGALTAAGVLPASTTARDMVFVTGDAGNPRSQLYVGHLLDRRVLGFSADLDGGTLAALSSVDGGANLIGLRIDPRGRFAWGLSNDQYLVEMVTNPATGELTVRRLNDAIGAPYDLVVRPQGDFAYASRSRLYSMRVDRDAGYLTTFQDDAGTYSMRHLQMDPTGRFLFALDGVTDILHTYSIAELTGRISERATTNFTDAVGMRMSPSGRFLYVFLSSGDILAYDVNPTNGTLTEVTQTATCGPQPISIQFDSTGSTLVVANSELPENRICIFTVDRTTGVLSTLMPNQPLDYLPTSVAIEPAGDYVYVTDMAGDAVRGYRLERAIPALVPLGVVASTADSPLCSALFTYLQ